MRYDDLAVGMKVLSNPKRTSNPDFKLHQSQLVTVIEMGLSLTWRTSGGFTSYGHTRTDKAVKVQPEEGEPFLQVAANLVAASDDNLARIARYRKEQAEREAERDRKIARRDLIAKRFETCGFKVHVFHKADGTLEVTVSGDDDVERLLDRLGG